MLMSVQSNSALAQQKGTRCLGSLMKKTASCCWPMRWRSGWTLPRRRRPAPAPPGPSACSAPQCLSRVGAPSWSACGSTSSDVSPICSCCPLPICDPAGPSLPAISSASRRFSHIQMPAPHPMCTLCLQVCAHSLVASSQKCNQYSSVAPPAQMHPPLVQLWPLLPSTAIIHPRCASSS